MNNNTVFSQGLKTGLIASVVSIVLVLLAYVIDFNMMSWTYSGVSYVLLIAVMVYGLLEFRKANGGYMAFSEGILIVLVAGLLATVISYFFNLLYYNVINPSYIEQVIENSKALVEKMGIGLTGDLEEQLRANAEKTTHFSVAGLGFSLVGAIFVWALFGAILGAIFSRKNPQNEI